MEKVIEVKPLDNYFIWILFADNFQAELNLQPYIGDGISSKLLDYTYFKQVKVDDFGGIAWENGFDFCPNYLRALTEQNESLAFG